MQINTEYIRFRNRMRYSVLLFTVLWNLSRANAVLPHCPSGQRIVCSSQDISTCQCSPITDKQGENCVSTETTVCGHTQIKVTYLLQGYVSRALKEVKVKNTQSVKETVNELTVAVGFGGGVEDKAEGSFSVEVSKVNRNLESDSVEHSQTTEQTTTFDDSTWQLWRKVTIKVHFGNGDSSESITEEYCDAPDNYMTDEELNQRAIQRLKDYYAYEGEAVTGPVLTHYWSHPRRQLGMLQLMKQGGTYTVRSERNNMLILTVMLIGGIVGAVVDIVMRREAEFVSTRYLTLLSELKQKVTVHTASLDIV